MFEHRIYVGNIEKYADYNTVAFRILLILTIRDQNGKRRKWNSSLATVIIDYQAQQKSSSSYAFSFVIPSFSLDLTANYTRRYH